MPAIGSGRPTPLEQVLQAQVDALAASIQTIASASSTPQAPSSTVPMPNALIVAPDGPPQPTTGKTGDVFIDAVTGDVFTKGE